MSDPHTTTAHTTTAHTTTAPPTTVPSTTVVARLLPGRAPAAERGLAALLTAYHLRTQAEKGEAVGAPAELPERYRRETQDPLAVFAADTVLVATDGGTPVGCLVLTAPADGHCELKRLWTTPAARGRGVASRLVEAALEQAAGSGARTVRLSVWDWRTRAIALYERHGFTRTSTWDVRQGLVCMERAVPAAVA